MSYEDEMADLRSNVKIKLLERDLADEKYHPTYWKWKKLYEEYVKRYWSINEEHFHSAEEATNHMLLDDILNFDLDEYGLTSAEKLAEILKIDSSLLEYCDLQVSNEGILGILKYKTPLVAKIEIIKQAVALFK